MLNPVQISPCNINARSSIQVLRIKEMITIIECPDGFTFFPNQYYRKCMNTSIEIFILILRLTRVNPKIYHNNNFVRLKIGKLVTKYSTVLS